MSTPKKPRGAMGAFIPGGPIDWDQWTADAANSDRRKWPRSEKVLANQSAGQKRRFARERTQRAEALAAARAAAAWKPAPAVYDPLAYVTVTDRLFGSMQPGSWYATRDMAQVSGAKYQACKAFAVTWWREGWLKRTQNPDWKPPARPGMAQEPKWLYCLTPAGEQRHRLAAALL